ncbi:MAG: CHASE2 domain-containing protein [Proteobacteria bacterium]|nr:CHASE2 domain-containing protein [Pseudomonadota bacterium]
MNLLKKFLKHIVVIVILGYPAYQLLHHFHSLTPLMREVADFKFTDIYFGHFQKRILDDNIYFVDVGVKDKNTTRLEIAEFINNVNKNYKPKVIAIDVDFKIDTAVSDTVNEKLISSLNNDNIILSYDLKNIKGQWIEDKSELPINYNIVKDGFTNNLIANSGVEFGVERFFQPSILQNNDTLKHFSVVTSKKSGVNIDKSLLKDNNKVMINFKYKYHDAISIGDTNNYFKLKDKIVIVGLFSKNKKGNPLYNEDLHYTASNKFYLGKSPPNMYGGEVLATIISNINKNSFITYFKGLSFWINLILSLVVYLCLIHFLGKSHNVFTATIIFTQFGLVTFFVFCSIFIVHRFNIYLDLTVLGIITFFSVEFIGAIDHLIHLVESKFIPAVKNKFNKKKL